jgi:hypothetical protein
MEENILSRRTSSKINSWIEISKKKTNEKYKSRCSGERI